MHRIDSLRAPFISLLVLVALCGASFANAEPRTADSENRSSIARPARTTPGAAIASRRQAARRARGRRVHHSRGPVPAGLATVPGSAGLRIAIDPVTGRLAAPTAEQSRALDAMAGPAVSHSAEGLEVVTLPDGSKMVNLQGRFMEYAIAVRDSTGRIRLGCVHGETRADSIVRSAARATGRE
jgi:hypothetical protein